MVNWWIINVCVQLEPYYAILRTLFNTVTHYRSWEEVLKLQILFKGRVLFFKISWCKFPHGQASSLGADSLLCRYITGHVSQTFSAFLGLRKENTHTHTTHRLSVHCNTKWCHITCDTALGNMWYGTDRLSNKNKNILICP